MPEELMPVSFLFSVRLANAKENVDSSFQEVSGLASQIDLETVAEGGQNRFVHQLPTTQKAQRLVLKRGVARSNSLLIQWCKEVFDNDLAQPIRPMNIEVSLTGGHANQVLRRWSLVNAWPVQWDVEPFNARSNEVSIEKIELCYAYLKRIGS